MRALLCFVVLLLTADPAFSQQIIINELFNSGSTGEWVELVVVTDGLDLRGCDLRDFSSGGTPQDPLEFLHAPLWNSLEAGTVIIAARPDTLIPEDLDPSDFVIRVNTSNTDLFDGPLFVFAGSSDAIQIRDSMDQHIFGLSWGTGNAGSLPEPRVHFAQASASNTAASFTGDEPGEATSTDHWLWDNPGPTPGSGNSIPNTNWIDSLRAITSSVGDGGLLTPRSAQLFQNYPNPFNSQTKISYTVGSPNSVILGVYDLLGREVALLVDERKSIGTHSLTWDAAGLPSGVYYYRIHAGAYVETRKLVLLK
jgi:hypothetical protein